MKTKISVNKKWIISLLIYASLFTTCNVLANANNIELLADNVVIISEICLGCGTCVEMADTIFELNSDGIATIKKQPTDEEERDAVKEAQINCPRGCIFTNF